MATQPVAGAFRGWEYAARGDYHRELDLNWSYAPTYLRKLDRVDRFMATLPADATILDAGCGEGVLVEKYAARGRLISGLDLNYESPHVRLGDVLDIPVSSDSLDAVMLLDVFEHLTFADQPRALAEIRRVLKPGGRLLLSVPNLAHLNSRVRFLWRGRLDRTDIETNHVGERPCWENEKLLRKAGFAIEERTGVTLTVPYLYRALICRHAMRLRWLHDLLEPLARCFPSLAMLNLYTCRKGL